MQFPTVRFGERFDVKYRSVAGSDGISGEHRQDLQTAFKRLTQEKLQIQGKFQAQDEGEREWHFLYNGPRYDTLTFQENKNTENAEYTKHLKRGGLPKTWNLEDLDPFREYPENYLDGSLTIEYKFSQDSGRPEIANADALIEKISEVNAKNALTPGVTPAMKD